jgi:hypothetical protein
MREKKAESSEMVEISQKKSEIYEWFWAFLWINSA